MKISDAFEALGHLPRWIQACWFVWLVAGAFLLIVSVNVGAQRKPTGRILAPQQNEQVARTVDVSGSVENLPPGYTLWLAVRIGDLWWPKEPKVFPSGSKWSGTLSEGGNPPQGRFTILLLLANRGASEEIDKWLKRGDYAGLRRDVMNGIEVLDEVNVRLR